MAFMQPFYAQGTFVVAEIDGEQSSVPEDVFSPEDHGKMIGMETGWFYRLSAPGYMDCTEWCGPFETEDGARSDLSETWEVDPDTGDDLPEED